MEAVFCSRLRTNGMFLPRTLLPSPACSDWMGVLPFVKLARKTDGHMTDEINIPPFVSHPFCFLQPLSKHTTTVARLTVLGRHFSVSLVLGTCWPRFGKAHVGSHSIGCPREAFFSASRALFTAACYSPFESLLIASVTLQHFSDSLSNSHMCHQDFFPM
jgi:hypothetical protein